MLCEDPPAETRRHGQHKGAQYAARPDQGRAVEPCGRQTPDQSQGNGAGHAAQGNRHRGAVTTAMATITNRVASVSC